MCAPARGARSSGMLHAVFLLLFMLVAAPLASYIPLAALAAVLAVVAWNMAEKHEFATLLRASRGDAVVLLATFLLVVFRDLTEGILVGFGIGALLFLHRMAQAVEIESGRPVVEEDRPTRSGGNGRKPYDVGTGDRSGRGGLPDLGRVLLRRGGYRRGGARPHRRSIRRPMSSTVSAVPMLDSTAAITIEGFVRKAHRQGCGGLYRRGAAADPPRAADPWRAAASGPVPVHGGRCDRGRAWQGRRAADRGRFR